MPATLTTTSLSNLRYHRWSPSGLSQQFENQVLAQEPDRQSSCDDLRLISLDTSMRMEKPASTREAWGKGKEEFKEERETSYVERGHGHTT